MCGISGIVGHGAEDLGLQRRLMGRLAHRGPDDIGSYVDGGCSLGHNRLSIIDIAGGHEPILDDEEQRAIIYNGEIYNHERLRRELEETGIPFKTHSDAEVPLHFLATTPPRDALPRLDGMFSFAIWDSATGTLTAARDPFGIKPFFWTRIGGAFVFASEMKAFFAHPEFEPRIDDEAVREKAVFEYLLPGSTWFEGVHELPAGHFLVTDGQDVRIERYHTDAVRPVPTDPDAIGRELHGLLRDAVEKRLMSEVPLGTILSGGLDSSLIAALNRELDPDRDITTFSIAENEDNEDFQRARLVAETLGTTHHESFITRDDYERDLAEMVWANEDIDHETYFFLPLFARMRTHATVGLCGQGADEVFAGYDRYKDIPGHVAKLRERTRAAFPHEPDRHDHVFDTHYKDLPSFLEWDRGAQLSDFQLRLVDRNSMAHGTEIRVPFLDKKVVAFGKALPPAMLLGGGTEKVALRLAARNSRLPSAIVERRKVPAGRSTARGIVDGFEADVEAAYPALRAERHPYAKAFRKKVELLMFDLFHEVHIERRGERPHDLSWNDLL